VKTRYETLAITTHYWRPGEDPIQTTINSIRDRVEDNDNITISEKAISTALGNIVDESTVNPGWLARLLAKYWMRYVWGCVLGPLCNLKKKTIRRFRTYPLAEGSAHKQVALEQAGFWQALMHGSEGAIDGSNLPYSYVSLPLRNAQQIAERIHERVKAELDKRVAVIIVDTDKTYSLGGFHFTPRPKPVEGIRSGGGFITYVFGRLLRLRRRATPIAVAGSRMEVEEVLEISELSNRARGFGAGRNVWDMAELFGVSLTSVTWDMLDKVEHKPIVIVRRA